MSLALRHAERSSLFLKNTPKQIAESQALGNVNVDKIADVDTFNSTITDIANEGKLRRRKALNILLTVGLGVAAFFTGKRITKTAMGSLCNSTTYLDGMASGLRKAYGFCTKPLSNVNVEKGNFIVKGLKRLLLGTPKAMKKYAKIGTYRDIELERYAKKIGAASVDDLSQLDLERFEQVFKNTMVKNAFTKLVSGTIGVVTGLQTFIEVGADNNKNGIPDLFEQKGYRDIVDKPGFDDKVIEQMRKMNGVGEETVENPVKELD